MGTAARPMQGSYSGSELYGLRLMQSSSEGFQVAGVWEGGMHRKCQDGLVRMNQDMRTLWATGFEISEQG